MTGRMRATTGDLDCVVARIGVQALRRAKDGLGDADEMMEEMADQVLAVFKCENAGDLDGAARHAVESAARMTLVAMLLCLFAAHNTPKKVVH